MLWISFLIVAVFIWLVFNNPFIGEKVQDSCEYLCEEMNEKKQQEGV